MRRETVGLSEDVVESLVSAVAETRQPARAMNKLELDRWQSERSWILNEFQKKRIEEAFWSDSEYEWFLNRILDHVGKS